MSTCRAVVRLRSRCISASGVSIESSTVNDWPFGRRFVGLIVGVGAIGTQAVARIISIEPCTVAPWRTRWIGTTESRRERARHKASAWPQPAKSDQLPPGRQSGSRPSPLPFTRTGWLPGGPPLRALDTRVPSRLPEPTGACRRGIPSGTRVGATSSEAIGESTRPAARECRLQVASI